MQDSSVTLYSHGVVMHGQHCMIYGPSRIVNRPDAPLQTGETMWIETASTVLIDNVEIK